MVRRIHEFLDHWVQERPDGILIMDHDACRLDARELDRWVSACQRVLEERGVAPGQRVLLVAENCALLCAFIIATSRLDAWAVPVNARLSVKEIDAIQDHCQASVIIFFSGISVDAQVHARHWKAEQQTFEGGTVAIYHMANQQAEPVAESAAEQVAVMLYTSGTTGQPKGVMLTHGNLIYVAEESSRRRGMVTSDHYYGVLPLSHIYGLAAVFMSCLACGCTMEILARFDPAHLAAALSDRITVLAGVPAMHTRLQAYADLEGLQLKAPHLRFMGSGGAPLDLRWRREVEDCFGQTLNNGYGLTESSATFTLSRKEAPRPDASVGPVLPGSRLRVVDEEGRDLSDGEVGELWLKGPGMTVGYYKNPEATAEAITPDGWFRSGDLGKRDGPDAIYVVGRKKELIIRSGFNVYPGEVEAVLNAQPAVSNAVVVGLPRDGDEQVVAFVTCHEGQRASEAELIETARHGLAAYKVPQAIIFLESMPAAATGKVLRFRLAEMARERFSDDSGDG